MSADSVAPPARLFFADSETDSDLYYLTGFHAGDPFLFLEVEGRRTLFLSDLEVDRARNLQRVDEVVRLASITEGEDLPAEPFARIGAIVEKIAAERGVGAFDVSPRFPTALADVLRGRGLGIRWRPAPFVPERECKTSEEIEHIRAAVRHTEAALQAGIERIANAQIRDGKLTDGEVALTSEAVRLTINAELLARECFCTTVIVAGGEQAVDPHDRGSGPLLANRPIILDVFPRDNKTRYCGDMTRTVVRGEASDEARRMFLAVKASKDAAEAVVRAGIDGQDVHAAASKVFEDEGFETGVKDGRMVGFFHGTGHGLGLDVHERPRVSKTHDILKAGHVITIEPGLYYPGIGGVRLEDDVVVTEDGCENLCLMSCEPFEI